MRIVFIGCAGAGKGTQAHRLSRYLHVPHLSTGEMLRQATAQGTELGQQADSYMKHGSLVPDELVDGIVHQRLTEPDCASGCLLDGYPRTLVQAESLDEFLIGLGTQLDLVLELRVDEEELVNRLLERGRKSAVPRADDTPRAIAKRIKVYVSQTVPILNFYSEKRLLRPIDGTGTEEEVFERIRVCVDRVKRKREESPPA